MIAIVVIGILVIASAGINAWIGRRRQGDSLERHERALSALRDLADHPQPIPAQPPAEPTDHVHILDERPAGAPPQRRRARRPPAKSRPTGRSRARALETRPIAANLPTRPSQPRGPVSPPPGEPEPVAHPEPALHFDDTSPAAPAVATSGARFTRPRFELPRIRVSARAAAVAALAAVSVVLLGTIAAVGITASGGTSHDKTASAPPPAAPPTTAKRPTPTTAPRPAVQFLANATGNGTVTVATPFTLELATTTLPCWVSVEDGTGRAVFTGTLEPGQRQQVTGTGPLTVRLGNSPAVQISVNGSPLNMPGVGKTANVEFTPPA